MALSYENDPWKELTGQCAAEVLSAPKTWGDPLRSPHMTMPQNLQGIVGYVRRNLIGKPWCDHLVLLAAILFSQNIQYRTIETDLCSLHSGFTDFFSGLGLQSMADWHVDTHLPLYLDGHIIETHTPAQRNTFWKRYQTASRHVKRWLSSLPTEQQKLYHIYALPYPDDPHELTRASGDRHIRYEQQEKRKADTDALMPFYMDLRTQAHLRYNMLVRLRKTYYKAITMVEQGKALLPFEFELREGGNERLSQPPTERITFRLWDRRTFVLDHQTAFSKHVLWDAKKERHAYSSKQNSYLLEYVHAESLDGKSPVVGLWFMELLEHDVLGDVAWGPQEEVAKKQAWLKAQGYGEDGDEMIFPFAPHTPEILVPSLRSGHDQFTRCARERTGAVFIPVEPFFVAAIFGMVVLHIITANGMRIGELQQLRASADCIVPIVISPAPEAQDQKPMIHWAVRAIPKGHRTPATYYFDDEHLRLLSVIKRMLCEHYRIDLKSGGDLPVVAMRGVNKHRFPPDRYLFQYNYKGLPENDLRVSMRFLVHGLVFQTLDGRRVTVRPHLLRHSFATWALNVAKEPIDIVAAILNQKNIAVTKYYGRPNPRAIAERSHGLMSQITSYIDVDDLILRSPEEVRELLVKAQKTHGTLARTRGGRCLLSGECPILFACVGCSAKAPDPAQRGEVEEVRQVAFVQIDRAKKKGLTLEVVQHQKKLKQCDIELHEMDMIEACREDEQREPEVNFEIDA